MAKDDDDLAGEWFDNPITQTKIRHARLQMKASMEELLDICARSSDPDVRAAHARYSQMSYVVDLLTKKGSYEQDKN